MAFEYSYVGILLVDLSRIMKSVPLRSSLETRMLPPKDLIRSLQIVSPRPTPELF